VDLSHDGLPFNACDAPASSFAPWPLREKPHGTQARARTLKRR
jgi:hypothetical protein